MKRGDDSEGYPFRGVPPTPAVVEFLALKLFHGRLVERQVIVDEVLRAHLAGGGRKPKAQDFTQTVKKALATMQEKGLAENPAVGHWRIGPALSHTPESTLGATGTPVDAAAAAPLAAEDLQLSEAVADVTVGHGTGAIYLYYLPTYRLRAEDQGEKVWPCKIGRSDRDPLSRVLSQAATALPERPHIALVVRSSNAAAWEAALHGVLTLRGRRIEDSPGSEWFLTSPGEVLQLVRFFTLEWLERDDHAGVGEPDSA